MKRRAVTGFVIAVAFLGATVGCGIQGPPVSPETIGMNPRLQREKARQAKEAAERKAQQPPAPSPGVPAQGPPAEGQPESQALAPEETQGLAPLEGSVQPSARPSGDVQVKPR